MKKTIYFLCVILITTFMSSSAKAQTLPCTDGDPTTGGCPVNSGTTNLPVNSGIIYLLVAGAAIGIVAVKKSKTSLVNA